MGKMNKKIEATTEATNAIETDAYDPVLWGSVRDNCTKIADLTGDASSEGMTSDVFHALYKSKPVIAADAGAAQKAVLETMMALPEYQDMRPMTRFDDMASALGVMELGPTVLEQFGKLVEKQESGKPETGPGNGPGNAPGEGEQPGEFSEEDLAGVRRAIRKAVKDTQEKLDEWEDLKAGWGIKPGELTRLSFKEKLELAESLKRTKDLKKIADLAGRFRNIALAAEATTPTHGVDEITNITLGDNIARLLPSELVKFKSAKLLFMKDFVEKQLVMYDLQGVEPVGCGPIIACLDISGSMAGEREVWAKAVILALMSLAEKQKRPFGVITFDTGPRMQKYFAKGNPTIAEKIEIASVASDGGGTSFYSPLMAAFEMRAQTSALKPADIVFCTDGECELSEKQLLQITDLKKTTSVRIFGVGITDRVGDKFEDLAAFSDNMAVVSSTGDISFVKSIMSAVAAKTR